MFHLTRRFTYLPLAVLVMSLLFIAGCDGSDTDDDDDDDNGNSATITVSGAVSGSYTGAANYAAAFGISWAVTIVLDDDKGTVVVTVFGEPGQDSWQIGEGSESGVASVSLTLTDLNSETNIAVLDSGTLNLTDRDLSNNRIKGNFNGQGIVAGTSDAISASGSFTATCIVLCDIGG